MTRLLVLALVVMMPMAAVARFELSDTSYFCGTGPTPKGMIKIECDVKGGIGKVPAYSLGEPRIEIYGDCLATMEQAMRAMEPFTPMSLLRNGERTEGMYEASVLWAEAKRCWSK